MDNNTTALVKVPGVGKKTAERLVIELRDRLKDWRVGAGTGVAPAAGPLFAQADNGQEAESALITLGYKPTEAAKMVAVAQREDPTAATEVLIRLALKSMTK